MAYVIYKSDGAIFLTLEDGQIDTANTSLTLVGKNVVNYGQYENSNIIHMLENFANSSSPINPVAGQLWFDKNSDVLRLKLYNGTTWNSLPNVIYSNTSTSLKVGDFWWDIDAQRLYIKSTTTNVLIGGLNASVYAADKLSPGRNINGVLFDGTTDITISSTLTNYLTFNNYLLGGNFNGSAATSVNVDVGDVSTPTPSKVVARDSNGDIYFRIGYGTATSSRYADLAEKYLTDKDYEVGTVMVIGGVAEVTQSTNGQRAIGVVSANPGFMMNQDLKGGTYIALKGRVPVKVRGNIKKGQQLVAGNEGRATPVVYPDPNTFAIALEDSRGENIIEALIL